MAKTKPRSSHRKGSKKRRRVPKRTAIKRARKLLKKPRHSVKKGLSATNEHNFARNRTAWINLLGGPSQPSGGVTEEERVTTNADGTYAIVDLSCFWAQFPDCQDMVALSTGTHEYKGVNAFKELFSQYKITGIDTRLTPNFSKNMPASHRSTDAIPNYEVQLCSLSRTNMCCRFS